MKHFKTIIILFFLSLISFNASAQRYKNPQSSRNYVAYQGEAVTGYGIALDKNDLDQFYVETIHGLRFTEKVFLGLGFGYSSAIETYDGSNKLYWESYFSVFANFKYYFLMEKSPVSFFASMSGGYLVSMDYTDTDGFSITPAIGISIRMVRNNTINLSIGYDFQGWTESYGRDNYTYDNNALALKVGFSF